MTDLSLRPYQFQCVQHSRERNTIVNLPTGHGKTLIAVQRVDDTVPAKKVGFLVPTRALVEQQAAYIAKHSSNHPRIEKLIGEDQATWKKSDWDECVLHTDVFVGTAAVFTKAIVTDRYLDLREFGLMIFDECHHAVGNSPMASIMRDAVVPYYNINNNNRTKLSILGLTASFVNGNLKNLAKKRRDLEALMQSKIFCPDITTSNTSSATQFHQVPWIKEDVSHHVEVLSQYVTESIQRIGHIKEVKKVLSRCVHVFEELGRSALMHFVQNIIVRQLLDKLNQLVSHTKDPARQALARTISANIPRTKSECQTLLSRLQTDPMLASMPMRTNKLSVLIDLLKTILANHGSTYRGIVFVEQVALVSPLAFELNEHSLNVGAIAGTGHQSDREREGQLSDFRRGKSFILVSTAALEEGIDVPDCSFVIRYTAITTTKSHIQGAGRARNICGNIYYFANAVSTEQLKATSLQLMAKDSRLSLSNQEMKSRAHEIGTIINGKHPYPFNATTVEGTVSVFNCKQILNQYCSKVLGKSVSPYHHLYSLDTNQRIEHVRFPTPQGWMNVNVGQSVRFWGNIGMDVLFPPDRSKNLNTTEKAEALVVYVAVLELRAMNLLDRHNRPALSLTDLQQVCPLDGAMNASITVKSLVLQSRPSLAAQARR